MQYLRNEPLKTHTSFRIGGPAEYFCEPENVEEIKEALIFAKNRRLRVSVIGAGSNLLVPDMGVRGLVIKLAGGLDWIKIEGGRVKAGAGVLISKLLKVLSDKELGGLEFLAGIPGTVGGAVAMNAGAWGNEIGGFTESIKAVDLKEGGEIAEIKELEFGYRKSAVLKNPWIVSEATFRLRRKSKKEIEEKIEEYLLKRKALQPPGLPNCGSVFKNPTPKSCPPAGWLIEAAGCKGLRVGDARVSEKHANFIENLGEAKANDVIKLMAHVQKRVRDKFKILLEPEVKIMVKSQT